MAIFSKKSLQCLFLIWSIANITACVDMGWVANNIDCYIFIKGGSTLFSEPEKVSLKEIHIDNGVLVGRTVIIQGNLLKVGDYSTFAVVADEVAQIIIVLTHLDPDAALLENIIGKQISVLGTIYNAKKGLPIIQAQAIKVLEDA